MRPRRRALLLTEGGSLAHPTRSARLAELLVEAGAEVIFGTSGEYLPYVGTIEGVRTIEISSPPTAEVLRRIDAGKLFCTSSELEAQFTENLELIKEFRPHLVFGDLRLTLPMACRQSGVPCLMVINAHWSPRIRSRYPPPASAPTRIFGPRLLGLFSPFVAPSLLKYAISPLNDVRRAFGFTPYRSMREALCDGDFVLYVGLPFLHVPELPSNHLIIGPLVWRARPRRAVDSEANLPVSEPGVFVTMGSSGDEGLVRTIVSALSHFEGTLLVTHSDPPSIEALRPRGTFVKPFIPIQEALQHADLMVGNGGTSTILASLVNGTPYFGIYTNLDQALSIEYYRASGAVAGGLSLQMSPRRISKSVEAMLADVNARRAAERCRDQFVGLGGDQWTVDRLRSAIDMATNN